MGQRYPVSLLRGRSFNTVDSCQQIIKEAHNEAKTIEEVITDGGYDSIDNREEMLKEERPTWSIAKMKGGRRAYQMDHNQAGELEVYDSKSGEQCEVHFSEGCQKYVIQSQGGYRRYMTTKQIENYIQYQQIEDQVNEESYNLRATVESTIHQTFHRLKKNNKVVYRGLIKCQWYALSRAFWVNVVRIMDKDAKKAILFVLLDIEHYIKSIIVNRQVKIHCQTRNYKLFARA